MLHILMAQVWFTVLKPGYKSCAAAKLLKRQAATATGFIFLRNDKSI